MSVSVTAGLSPYRDDSFAKEDLASHSSGSATVVALTAPLTVISGSTSTGFSVNHFSLSTASAVEGQFKSVIFSGTGEAYLDFTGTATGSLVLTGADDAAHLRYINAKWYILETTATFASAT